MKTLIFRENAQFKIDEEQLKPAARNQATVNALYGAVYSEFRGAATNPIYKNMTNLQKFNKINEFAVNWLKTRGLE